MARPNKRTVLMEKTRSRRESGGQSIPQFIEHSMFASRRDLLGKTDVSSNTPIAICVGEYEIRDTGTLKPMPRWEVHDLEEDIFHRVESVQRPQSPRRRIALRCKAVISNSR